MLHVARSACLFLVCVLVSFQRVPPLYRENTAVACCCCCRLLLLLLLLSLAAPSVIVAAAVKYNS